MKIIPLILILLIANAVSAQNWTLCEQPLRQTTQKQFIQTPLSEDSIDLFDREGRQPKNLKIGIALPEGFDPDKPQRVIWVSGAINSEEQRLTGNIGGLNRWYQTATEAGWVVIAIDTNLGNPRPTGDDDEELDLEVQTEGINHFIEAWPEFATWEFVCAGHSGGAKQSFYRMGDLLESDLNVIGIYLAGCNEDRVVAAHQETDFKKRALRDIKVWISNGKDDPVSKQWHAERVAKSLESHRFEDIHLELHEGDHEPDMDAFRKALTWFITEQEDD